MSQAWHEHLNNLSWWEQIDRFFFPSKYSCTMTPSLAETVFSIFLVVCTIVFIIGLLIKFSSKEAQKHD